MYSLPLALNMRLPVPFFSLPLALGSVAGRLPVPRIRSRWCVEALSGLSLAHKPRSHCALDYKSCWHLREFE
ncbi:uncharacterized protein F5891DRAFT_1008390 [Suillus fuscotomentosus]|uniref:Uncharacterized protein n=1 Tax=Suillus fuscotomentosus TaxID=1912939 RepID=A0AAD4HDL1_9AGAM|nr:uncharacterized protein F5891DRAFT_1069278 [Suillus fuscotomentosus]XP_041230834.1 uncharacterized protein F5891DRAFT_1008390 [Suillus fuscotomentosus]KAG1891778.1 hypothetical protein F5891DRAFT_1069278 [Suillus fuscotomentosus]KAG1905259.1 hypothetical protein F5891DRAFT_1008390 [Suillus fuscotomentosus]